MPLVLEQEGVFLQLASGEMDGKTGPIQTFTPISSFFGTVQKGTRIQITAKEGYWKLLYLVKANINIDMESAEKYQLVVFEKENEDIIICAEEDSTLLFLSAEPIEEPIAAKDNFVMNSMEEIEEAMANAAAGKFGRLTYKFHIKMKEAYTLLPLINKEAAQRYELAIEGQTSRIEYKETATHSYSARKSGG